MCKRLIGYTKSELRAINIKDNTHSGEWDLEELAKWTADLNIDLGVKLDNKDQMQKKIKEMELIRFEKYDYVLLVCRNELDYNELQRKLGIQGAKVSMGRNRTIKGRAIWYDQIKAQIVEGGAEDGESSTEDRLARRKYWGMRCNTSRTRLRVAGLRQRLRKIPTSVDSSSQ